MNRKTWRFYFAGTMILLMSFFSGGLIQAQAAAGGFDLDRRLLCYEQCWVWVAAYCLFLLLLVLALREERKFKI